ncbi:hypothetical protein PL75_10610 [Neisseria arctica]|uniref:RiboL-PSP-HEPN domain-containing protein n=1 Tax=Neisseria arctica TaxID=1470200 RepID=A0A0J1C160_9NEIS|nr:HEPN domain-containing protein [Neisseria arctica]KLT71998.1 hypothetical protein PL75_10610 [Neisseria arctica]UOO86709.1 hypothetical protein LVJ86_00130 [Neisseria arctica]
MKTSLHFRHVEEIYSNYRKDEDLLNKLLPDNPDLASFISDYRLLFGKNLIVLCANFFELYTLDYLPNFLAKNDELLCNFIKKQALDREYHKLFDWKVSNANKFLRLFGDNFKEKIEEEIKNDLQLMDKQNQFMKLGKLRNDLVHEGFKSEIVTGMTIDEIWAMFNSSCDFYEFILKSLEMEREEYFNDFMEDEE